MANIPVPIALVRTKSHSSEDAAASNFQQSFSWAASTSANARSAARRLEKT